MSYTGTALFSLEDINTGVTANDGQGDPLRTAFSKTFSNSRTLSGQMLSISGYLDNRITEQFSSGALNNTGQYLEDEIADLSGNLNSTGQSLSGNLHSTGQSLLSTIDEQLNATGQYIHNNFVSGYVQNFIFDMPESGQSVQISGVKTGGFRLDENFQPYHNNWPNDSLYRGKYTLTLTERHTYYYREGDSAIEDWSVSGAFWLRDVMKYLDGHNRTSNVYTIAFPVTSIGNGFEGGSHEYTVRLSGIYTLGPGVGSIGDYQAHIMHQPSWIITRASTHTYTPHTGHGRFKVNGDDEHNRKHQLLVNLVEY